MSGGSIQRRLALASVLLAASVLGSRLLGFVRDAVIAYLLGAGRDTDMYYAAFTLPDMMNYFLSGGALSITFVPLYGRFVASGDTQGGARLVGVVAATVGAVMAVLIVVAEVVADPVVAALFPGFDAEQLAGTALLTRIVLPAQLFFFVGGILSAVCMVHERFVPAAVAPLVYNLGIIVFGVLLEPSIGVAGFSVGALVGAVAGPFLIPLVVARRFVKPRLRLSVTDPLLRRYAWISLPLMVGVTLLTADEWIARYFASDMTPGTITWLNNARRVMLVPMALIGQAAAQAALPYLSKLVAEERRDELATTLTGTLRAALFLATLAAVALFWLAEPVITAIYERGLFTRADSAATAEILLLYCPAVVAWATQTIAVRGFYAHTDTWRPMLLGTVVTLAALPVYAWLADRLEGPGLALATSIGLSAFAVATIALYRRVHGLLSVASLLSGLARGLLVATVASAVVLGVALALEGALEAVPRAPRAWLEVAGGGALFGLAALLVTRRLGGPEADALGRVTRGLGRVLRRLRRGSSGGDPR